MFIVRRIKNTDFLIEAVKASVVASAVLFTGVVLSLIFSPKTLFAQQEDGRYPYTDTMVISAYYSPLPDQARYVTGSYEGDIRLNGSGVNGADGTPVFPGMIAAPPTYPFGFKMKIPGIGTVAVHDRGGAIKGNRLDVWMGYGDEGLNRALSWGKRTIDVEMYGVDESVKESVYLEGYQEAEKFVRKVAKITRLFPNDIWYESEGEEVVELQTALKDLGYFEGEVDGFYGEETLHAVFEFQKDNGIIVSWDDLGAGHCGVQTRALLEKKIEKSKNSKKVTIVDPSEIFYSKDISLGAEGDEVEQIQRELLKMNFLRIQPTGKYDELTAHAVFKFQQKMAIVNSESDAGAGVVGPKTREALNRIANSRIGVERKVAAKKNGEVSEAIAFAFDMEPGMQHEKVVDLQSSLKKLGHFEGDVTDFYGPVTQSAVIAFQLDQGLIGSEDESGAGRVGPRTREALNKLL